MKIEKLIKGAQEWAANGVPVFPCDKNKRPLEKGGFHTGVTDPDAVDALFRKFNGSAHMVGARMGKDAGLFAVDVDLYKGDAPKDYMELLKGAGELPPTREHKTKNGGLHFLYRSDKEWPNVNPCSGVEVKGEGGYIIVPPSSGYKVLSTGIVSAPPSLITRLTKATRARSNATVTALQQQVMSGAVFHDALAGMAARLAGNGVPMLDVMNTLKDTLAGSVASSPTHERHMRWAGLMADNQKELSRIVSTGYDKFSPHVATEAIKEVATDVYAEYKAIADKAGLLEQATPEGNLEVKQVEDYGDEWPFEGTGYFASVDHDLLNQKFVMHPFFAEDETTVLFAEPKIGKTAWNLTASLHIACGMDFGPSLKVSEARPCLYYALEGGRAIKLRIAAWRKEMAATGVELPKDIPMFVVERNQNFLKEAERLAACNQIIAANNYCIKKYGVPLGVISLDTLTKAMSSGDQNSVDDTSALFELVGILREGGVSASIVFVHHKARTGGVRGSTNIEAEPDVLLDVSKGKVDKTDIVVRVSRARSIEDGGSYEFATKTIPLGVTNQGIDLSSFIVIPKEAAEVADSDMASATEYSTTLSTIIAMAEGEGGVVTVAAAFTVLAKLGIVDAPTKVRASSKAVQEFFENLLGDTGCVYRSTAVSLVRSGKNISGILVRPLK